MARPPIRSFRFPWRSRAEIARDVDAELGFHLDMRIGELEAQGMDADAARRAASAEFGDLEGTRAYCRAADARGDRVVRVADRLTEWRHDAHYAWRTMRRTPTFTVVALLTLALAIGANTAIFSVVRAVLLRPLPYADPARLMVAFESWPDNPGNRSPMSPPDYVDYRAQQRAFTDLGAYSTAMGPVVWQPDGADPTTLTGISADAHLFRVLGVRPLLGRVFDADADVTGDSASAIISYGFWQRALGADPHAIGRRLTLNGRSTEIIGVMPRGFVLDRNEEVWLPLDIRDDLANAAITRKQHWMIVIGRLRPGVTIDAARADLRVIAQRLAAQYPDADGGRMAIVTPLHELAAGNFRTPLLLLQAAAAMVLLIACANLMNLTLSRTIGRRQELALRAALGAGRGRLVRQLLTESVLLALAGGALGIGLAIVATRALLAIHPTALPPLFPVRADRQVLGFSVLVSLVAGALFGIVPALHAMHAGVHDALKEGGRGSNATRSGRFVRRALVMTQVALAVMLLVGAGLLTRSFAELTRVRLGFEPDHVIAAQLRVSGPRYDSIPMVNGFYDAVLDNVAHAPGVTAAGAATMLPMQGSMSTSLRIEGQPVDESHLPDMAYVAIRGAFLEALRIPLIAGRRFDASDTPNGPKQVLINAIAARRFFRNGDAVGKRIRIGPNPNGEWMTVVGVVGDVRSDGIDLPPTPTLYVDHAQEAWDHTLTVVMRTADSREAVEALRRAVKDADPALPLRDVQSMNEVVGSSLAARRFALGLAGSFAGLALVLATLGIYGVLAYEVSTRTREFGVRLALGASPGSVLGLVARRGLAWSVAGLALGMGGAVAGARLLAGALFGVGPLDADTYLLVAAGSLAVVTAACLIPARRATRVDPLSSMRAD
ncbi:MAG TPA: ABC transporter permease [Gemmatimonadaceae bacterium]|nr:ABC transporter permease [Gemmatimonadaceae bacterium]